MKSCVSVLHGPPDEKQFVAEQHHITFPPAYYDYQFKFLPVAN